MRRVYLIHGEFFDLSEVIIGEDRLQGTDTTSGNIITIFKHNIMYIEG
jgi:hypothetical protein